MTQYLKGKKIIVSQARDNMAHIVSQHRINQIHKWLFPSDPSTNLNMTCKLRYPSSGEWFLQSPNYAKWKSDSKSCLWLNGKPGCGKTVLSSTIIEDLQASISDSQLLYFFFDFNAKAKQSLEKLFLSLIYQLYCKVSGAQGIVDSVYSFHQDGGSQPSLNSLCETFKNMAAHLKDPI